MRAVAGEMNLPATAFVAPRGAEFDLRWFTAVTELTLCGHGTLATAHVLWESRRLAPEALARFQTPSGLLTARRAADWIEPLALIGFAVSVVVGGVILGLIGRLIKGEIGRAHV